MPRIACRYDSFELAPPGSRHLGDANGISVGGDLRLVQVRDDVSTAQRLKTTVHDPLTAPTRPEYGLSAPRRTSDASTSPAPASAKTCTAADGRPRRKG